MKSEDLAHDIREIFTEIEQVYGQIPNIYKTFTRFPLSLRNIWDRHKTIIFGGKLRRELKQVIALVVSHATRCEYCTAAHRLALHQLGFDAERVLLILNNPELAGFSSKEVKLLEVARRQIKGVDEIIDRDREELLKAGWTTCEIIEAVRVIDLFKRLCLSI